jgi:hypothetical protein
MNRHVGMLSAFVVTPLVGMSELERRVVPGQ